MTYAPTSEGRVGVRLISNHIFLIFAVPVFLLAQAPNTPDSDASQTKTPAAAAPAPVAAPAPAPTGNAVPVEAAPLPGQPGSKQDKRIFGVLPNYRTADGTVPFERISAKRKFYIAMKDTFDYPSYVLAAALSSISQFNDSNPSFGEGVKGYAHRYVTAVADQDIGNFMTEAIWPTLLHQDPRYFRKVHGSVGSRLGYALTRVLVTRTDAGNWRFNASEILGNASVGAIGNLYYPDSRGWGPTAQRAGTQIATDAISGVLKEFWPDIKRKFSHKKTGVSAD